MTLEAPSKLPYSVSLYYIHKVFSVISLWCSLERKKGNTLCINISNYTKVNIYIWSKIITRVYRFREGIKKSCLKFSLDIQPQHMNLLHALYWLDKWSSCFCDVASHNKFLWGSIIWSLGKTQLELYPVMSFSGIHKVRTSDLKVN